METRLSFRPKGIIFDCDGVLIDSRKANAGYYNRVLAVLGLPPMTREQDSYAFMATSRQALEYIVPPNLHARIPEACRQVSYCRDILPLLELQEGLREFLAFLQSEGIRCAVHTNRTDTMDEVLHFFGLEQYFAPVMTAGTAKPKPSPEGVWEILRQWSCQPEEVLFLGDSTLDELTAARAGVPFAAFCNPQLGGLAITSFRALETLLRNCA